MRDDLVGYLFDALDVSEVERVESALADPQSGPAASSRTRAVAIGYQTTRS